MIIKNLLVISLIIILETSATIGVTLKKRNVNDKSPKIENTTTTQSIKTRTTLKPSIKTDSSTKVTKPLLTSTTKYTSLTKTTESTNVNIDNGEKSSMEENSSEILREEEMKRDVQEPVVAMLKDEDSINGLCDFGKLGDLTWCSWTPDKQSGFHWKLGAGRTHLSLGGPELDRTSNSEDGGYIYLELHEKSKRPGNAEATFNSSVLENTIKDPNNGEMFVSFDYSVSNSGYLEVVLVDVDTGSTKSMWKRLEPTTTKTGWESGCFAYAHDDRHQIVFIGRHSNPSLNSFKTGCHYLAIDDLRMGYKADERCKGYCAFTKDFCDWTNDEDQDNFDWKIGRSSHAGMGPSNDVSDFGKFVQIGAYVYADFTYPQKPYDVAMLTSPKFTSTESPLCMKFQAYFDRSFDGTLRVVQKSDSGLQVKWVKSENNDIGIAKWAPCQVLLSSNDDFEVVIESVASSGGDGTIAIDNVSFQPGLCSVMPSEASSSEGSCDFEKQSICRWKTLRIPIDGKKSHQWVRRPILANAIPRYDYKNNNASGYYMGVIGNGYSSASLISPTIQNDEKQCLSFMFIMWKQDVNLKGSMIGVLRVSLVVGEGNNETRHLLWRIRKHQGDGWINGRAPIVTGESLPPKTSYKIEISEESDIQNGIDNREVIAIDDVFIFNGDCEIHPKMATAISGECDFQKDLCGWKVTKSNENDVYFRKNEWHHVKLNSNRDVADHTCRKSFGGFVNFHVDKLVGIDARKNPKIDSPILTKSTPRDICFTFWYRGTLNTVENVSLSVNILTLKEDLSIDDEKTKLVWKDSRIVKGDWVYGSVHIALTPKTLHRIQFEGSAKDAGYCVDDIIILEGTCTYRPKEAAKYVSARSKRN